MLDAARTPDWNFIRRKWPTAKIHLVLSHLYLLPWFVRRLCQCELPLRPFLDANPDLELGGLPIAPKLSRYGEKPPYLPSLTIDGSTEAATIEAFAEEHSFPLVIKPLFGAHSRGVRKVGGVDEIVALLGEEPMMLQPHVDAPKEYGINVMRIGSRIKIYGLTEVRLRSVWGDGTRRLETIVREKYDPAAAARVDEGDWVPPKGCRVPLQTAADAGTGSTFRDVTEKVTPALRTACRRAADQIGLRFGRFDVKAESLEALLDGEFFVLEANGSPSLDLTLFDRQHSLSRKIERLRVHWDQLYQQAQPRSSNERNSWRLLSVLLWYAVAPKQCAASFWNKVDDGELAAGP